MKQLESSRFRWINEQLYSTTGDEAVTMFAEDPNLFDIYHRGFTNQVKLWPANPVDKIIEWLKKRPTSHVVADFGCGEAVIAQTVTNKVPLSSASVDVAVFCLSLMGTDLVDFLREAHRVLKPGGILKVLLKCPVV
ncbi:25S rRNA (adenine645-N1)-methyltransferase [Desmophyllum pertusum]|uniref:Ribosomal RNA-processing protein 8 n=1 Tax=Desmophyllum pertusum TaxID=174260 RepID=A0A9X0D9C7_9CNID|nr:25S rRNA (adenine645-N1)-methyltransferase [Desmophyllum pertusum]